MTSLGRYRNTQLNHLILTFPGGLLGSVATGVSSFSFWPSRPPSRKSRLSCGSETSCRHTATSKEGPRIAELCCSPRPACVPGPRNATPQTWHQRGLNYLSGRIGEKGLRASRVDSPIPRIPTETGSRPASISKEEKKKKKTFSSKALFQPWCK